MKRKSLAAALAAAMMLSLTACGNDAADTASTTGAETSTEAETEADADTETEAESETEAEEESQEEEAEPEAEEEEEQEEESAGGYTKGVVDGNNFESEWLGIRYEAPEGFIMASEEELEALLVAGGELIYEDDAQTMIDFAKLTTVYEMMTYLPQADGAGNPNLNLVVEKNNYSAQEYGEALKTQVDTQYAGLGMDVEWGDTTNDSVAGLDCIKYTVDLELEDMVMSQAYYITEKDGRVICFILSYTGDMEAEADALMNAFQPL